MPGLHWPNWPSSVVTPWLRPTPGKTRRGFELRHTGAGPVLSAWCRDVYLGALASNVMGALICAA